MLAEGQVSEAKPAAAKPAAAKAAPSPPVGPRLCVHRDVYASVNPVRVPLCTPCVLTPTSHPYTVPYLVHPGLVPPQLLGVPASATQVVASHLQTMIKRLLCIQAWCVMKRYDLPSYVVL